ncbi:hypothetical protein RP20_CCG027481 [Aedes albopictus]|nr:hypothetical protein RP20_CCG027481 [Aedes albopictus]
MLILAGAALLLLGLAGHCHCEPYGGGGGGGGGSIGGGHYGLNGEMRCPRLCSCTGQTVDCSHRGLTQVPRKIPLDTDRLFTYVRTYIGKLEKPEPSTHKIQSGDDDHRLKLALVGTMSIEFGLN